MGEPLCRQCARVRPLFSRRKHAFRHALRLPSFPEGNRFEQSAKIWEPFPCFLRLIGHAAFIASRLVGGLAIAATVGGDSGCGLEFVFVKFDAVVPRGGNGL